MNTKLGYVGLLKTKPRKQTSPRVAKLGAQFLRMSIKDRIAYCKARPDLAAKALGTLSASAVAQDETRN